MVAEVNARQLLINLRVCDLELEILGQGTLEFSMNPAQRL